MASIKHILPGTKTQHTNTLTHTHNFGVSCTAASVAVATAAIVVIIAIVCVCAGDGGGYCRRCCRRRLLLFKAMASHFRFISENFDTQNPIFVSMTKPISKKRINY